VPGAKLDKTRFKRTRQIGLLTMIPIVLAVSPIVGFFLGKFLDSRLKTAPYLMTLFTLLGFAAGAFEVYRLIVAAGKDE